ncbi:unnamed protein product, partial [marine sediment metagenome]
NKAEAAYLDGRVISNEISKFVDAYNSTGLTPIRRMTKQRRIKLVTRLRDPDWAAMLDEALLKLPLGGKWQPDFDWITLNEENLLKLAEGKYDNWGESNGNGSDNGQAMNQGAYDRAMERYKDHD